MDHQRALILVDNIPRRSDLGEDDQTWKKARFSFVWFDVVDREREPDETAALKEARVEERSGIDAAADYMWQMRGRGAERIHSLYEGYDADFGEPREVVQAVSKEEYRLKINAERARR